MQVSEAFTAFVADAEPRLAVPWLPAMASRPGGRFAMTIWGNVGKSPGGWMFRPSCGPKKRKWRTRPRWSRSDRAPELAHDHVR
jgi:hypothetical protein